MGNELDRYRAKSYLQLIGGASLMVAEGTTRRVDVIRVETADEVKYGLSCIGWGIAGAVARKADELRWIPGQRKFRYDIAGFVTMVKDWPVNNIAKFEFHVKKPDGTYEWEVHEEIDLINMIATNVPKLGVDHPIVRG